MELSRLAELITRIEFDSILVIIDRLIEYTHIEPYLKTLTAEYFVYLLTKIVII